MGKSSRNKINKDARAGAKRAAKKGDKKHSKVGAANSKDSPGHAAKKGGKGGAKNGKKGAGSDAVDITAIKYPASRFVNPQHNILVLGEGDFSFGAAVVKLRQIFATKQLKSYGKESGGSLTLTGYDSRQQAREKYGPTLQASLEHISRLSSNTGTSRILHSVDATKLDSHPELQRNNFNMVVFNFPHSGQQRVHLNRQLIQLFFQSVKTMWDAAASDAKDNNNSSNTTATATPSEKRKKPIRRRREVHVTIKRQAPYTLWGIPELAQEAGFDFIGQGNGSFHFDYGLFSTLGYEHQTTVGPQSATTEPASIGNELSKMSQTLVFEYKHKYKSRDQNPSSTISNGPPSVASPPGDSTSSGAKVSSQSKKNNKQRKSREILAKKV
jgi:hypothetical protein